MSNISLLISLPIGIFGFLFLFWRRLKEDYPHNQIFSFGFIVMAFMLIGFVLGNFINIFFPFRYNTVFTSAGLWFWAAFILGCIGFKIASIKTKIRFLEALEAITLGFIFWFFVSILFNSIYLVNLKLLLFSLFQAFLIGLFFFLDTRYKSFTWYKSGKIGFTSLSVFGIFFAIRCIVALFDPSMLSFIGKSDAILSSIVSFLFFTNLYNLSEINKGI